MLDSKSLKLALTGSMLRRSMYVAAIIGSILNLINQGDVILNREMPIIWKIALTYCVPFLVASYGAYSALVLRAD